MPPLSTADLTDDIPDLPSEQPQAPSGPIPNLAPSLAPGDLVTALQATTPTPGIDLRKGVIVAVGDQRVTITVGGDPTEIPDVPFLDSFAPYVGAIVWVAQFGNQLLVLGGQSAFGAGGLPGEVFWHWSDSTELPGAILCYGQTITDAETTYPGLWTYAPAASKSGTSLTLPDLRGRTIFGRDNMGGSDAGRISTANTIGATGGAETHTLTTSNLPSHTHGFTTGSSGTHSHDLGGHTHSFSGSGTTSGQSNDHTHNTPGVTVSFAGFGQDSPINGNASNSSGFGTYGVSADHTHTYSFSGTTGGSFGSTGSDGSHTHSGTTDSAGSGTSVNHMPPHIVLNGFMRV